MLHRDDRYRITERTDRGGMFYCVDSEAGQRTTLETRDREVAERLVNHKSEALKNPRINRRIGLAFLSAVDPRLATRTWDDVMQDIIQDKTGPTRKRWDSAIKDPALHFLKPKVVVTTLPDDFLAVLRAGTVSTNVYLRRLQNRCLDLGWLSVPVLPRRKFAKIRHKEKRGIRAEEHAMNTTKPPECWASDANARALRVGTGPGSALLLPFDQFQFVFAEWQSAGDFSTTSSGSKLINSALWPRPLPPRWTRPAEISSIVGSRCGRGRSTRDTQISAVDAHRVRIPLRTPSSLATGLLRCSRA